MIHGGVECGPNAVLAFAREGYHKIDINAGRFAGNADLFWIPEDGSKILAHGSGRNVALV